LTKTAPRAIIKTIKEEVRQYPFSVHLSQQALRVLSVYLLECPKRRFFPWLWEWRSFLFFNLCLTYVDNATYATTAREKLWCKARHWDTQLHYTTTITTSQQNNGSDLN